MDRLPDRIQGEGVLLRLWRASDAEQLERMVAANIEHLGPWMPWIQDEPMDIHERRELLSQWEAEWERGGDAYLAVVRAGEIVGSCGLHRRIGPGGLEIGYWIDRNRLREGLATAVVRALTDAALGRTGVNRVEIHHDKANTASAGIPRKLGYELVSETPAPARAPAESGLECIWRLRRTDG
jgi:ribosomal-protein-serine acetyltransferase